MGKHKRKHASAVLVVAPTSSSCPSINKHEPCLDSTALALLNPAHSTLDAVAAMREEFSSCTPFPHLHVHEFAANSDFIHSVKMELEAQPFVEKVCCDAFHP
jgi:hypothetical protein